MANRNLPTRGNASPAESFPVGQGMTDLIERGLRIAAMRDRNQLAIALQRPRKLPEFEAALVAVAAEAGEDFYYSITFKRHVPGCQDRRHCKCPMELVEGPGAGLAREAARLFTNCSINTEPEDEDDDSWTIRSTFIDFENNFTRSVVKKITRMIPVGGGRTRLASGKEAERAYQAGISKCERDATLKCLPAHIVDRAFYTAKAAAAHEKRPIPEQVQRLIAKFRGEGVSAADIGTYIGCDFTLAGMTDKGLQSRAVCAHLRGVLTAISGGEVRAEDVFARRGQQQALGPAPKVSPPPRPASPSVDMGPVPQAAGFAGKEALQGPPAIAAEAPPEALGPNGGQHAQDPPIIAQEGAMPFELEIPAPSAQAIKAREAENQMLDKDLRWDSVNCLAEGPLPVEVHEGNMRVGQDPVGPDGQVVGNGPVAQAQKAQGGLRPGETLAAYAQRRGAMGQDTPIPTAEAAKARQTENQMLDKTLGASQQGAVLTGLKADGGVIEGQGREIKPIAAPALKRARAQEDYQAEVLKMQTALIGIGEAKEIWRAVGEIAEKRGVRDVEIIRQSIGGYLKGFGYHAVSEIRAKDLPQILDGMHSIVFWGERPGGKGESAEVASAMPELPPAEPPQAQARPAAEGQVAGAGIGPVASNKPKGQERGQGQ